MPSAGMAFNSSIVRTYATNGAYPSIASADFNNDGLLDLVLSAGLSGIIIEFGLDDGGLSARSLLDSGTSIIEPLAVADLNLDGTLDIIDGDFDFTNVGETPVLHVFMNNGDGTFAPPISYYTLVTDIAFIATGDINGDGFPDVVLCEEYVGFGAIQVFLNAGDGLLLAPFSLETPDPSNFCAGLAVADFNQDGRADVAVTDVWGPLYVMLSLPDGGFEGDTYFWPDPDAGTPFGQGAVLVLDREGKPPNLVFTTVSYNNYFDAYTEAATVTVLQNQGDGHFTLRSQFPAPIPGLEQTILMADLTGDCEPDLVIVGDTDSYQLKGCGAARGGAAILYGDGDGGFDAPSTFLLWEEPDLAPSQAALLGPVDRPQALAFGGYCGSGISVFGDASRH